MERGEVIRGPLDMGSSGIVSRLTRIEVYSPPWFYSLIIS